jgi:hypothetical protein
MGTVGMIGFVVAGIGFISIAVLRLVAESFWIGGFVAGVGVTWKMLLGSVMVDMTRAR